MHWQGKQMFKNFTMENLKAILAVLIILTIAWFTISSVVDLWHGIYTFLDQFIWAFFAGFIAIFFTIALIAMMIQIAIYSAALLVLGLGWLLSLFER